MSVDAMAKYLTRRTRMVQDMTVLLFGVDGAVSVESRGGDTDDK